MGINIFMTHMFLPCIKNTFWQWGHFWYNSSNLWYPVCCACLVMRYRSYAEILDKPQCGIKWKQTSTEQTQNNLTCNAFLYALKPLFLPVHQSDRVGVNLQEPHIRGWCRWSRGSRPGPGSWWLACLSESSPPASWWTPCQSCKCPDGSSAGGVYGIMEGERECDGRESQREGVKMKKGWRRMGWIGTEKKRKHYCYAFKYNISCIKAQAIFIWTLFRSLYFKIRV